MKWCNARYYVEKIQPPIIRHDDEVGNFWMSAWDEVESIEREILGFNVGPRPVMQMRTIRV